MQWRQYMRRPRGGVHHLSADITGGEYDHGGQRRCVWVVDSRVEHDVFQVLQAKEKLRLLLHLEHLPIVLLHAHDFHTLTLLSQERAVVSVLPQGRVILLRAGHCVEYI